MFVHTIDFEAQGSQPTACHCYYSQRPAFTHLAITMPPTAKKMSKKQAEKVSEKNAEQVINSFATTLLSAETNAEDADIDYIVN